MYKTASPKTSASTHISRMQPGAPMTPVEEDFWASADPSSRLFDWKFPGPPHTVVYLSKAVHTGVEPITCVSHDADDGALQFLGCAMIESGGVLACFHHPIDSDPSLRKFPTCQQAGMPNETNQANPGIRAEHQPEED